MRFLIEAHKARASDVVASTFKRRRAESMEAGIEIATKATAAHLQRNPQAPKGQIGQTPPTPSPVVIEKRPPGRPRINPIVPTLSTYHYVCRSANAVAQVWMRTGKIKGNIGRRAKGGRQNKQAKLPHEPGEYAVMSMERPLLASDGTVRVFKAFLEAEEAALHLWKEAPEDDRFGTPGRPIVYANEKVEVMFDPYGFGSIERPFYCWLPLIGRPIWVNRDFGDTPTLEETAQTYAHIVSAIRAAERACGRGWNPSN